jgi:DNA-binding NarL/FixJ family response regulator
MPARATTNANGAASTQPSSAQCHCSRTGTVSDVLEELLARLSQVADGFSDRQVAKALGITRGCASRHAEQVRRKLGVNSSSS